MSSRPSWKSLAAALAVAFAPAGCDERAAPAPAPAPSAPVAEPHHGCWRIDEAPDGGDLRPGSHFCFEADRYVLLSPGGDWDSRLVRWTKEPGGRVRGEVQVASEAGDAERDGGAPKAPHVFSLVPEGDRLVMEDPAGRFTLSRDEAARGRAGSLPRLERVCDAARRCMADAGKALGADLRDPLDSARSCTLTLEALRRILAESRLPPPPSCRAP